MTLTLVDDDDETDPAEASVLAYLTRAAGLASVGRIAERLGMGEFRVEATLKALVRRGLVRTCRWAEGVYYELIPKDPR